jgi:hypothetical protein
VDRNYELEELWRADRHIAKAEEAILNQEQELGMLRCTGYDTKLAERTQEVSQSGLQTMLVHRKLILTIIDQIDQGLI